MLFYRDIEKEVICNNQYDRARRIAQDIFSVC